MKTIDFRGATPGWRVVYLADRVAGAWFSWPLAGWLIQEDDTVDLPDRRVVPAVQDDGGGVYAATDDENFWYVRAPGDPDPVAPFDELFDQSVHRSKEGTR